jgi:hypothetical protein
LTEKDNKTVLVLISGKKRSGKDFFAKMMKERNDDIVITHFAREIKEGIAKLFETDVENINDLKSNSNVLDPQKKFFMRDLLQVYGTYMKEVKGRNYWVKKTTICHDCINVIPDWRFKHEFDFYKNDSRFSKIVTVRILGGDDTDTHVSENELNNFEFDFVVDNSVRDMSILDTSIEQIFKLIDR